MYEVTVEVTDDGSPAMSATRPVTVTVTDASEGPQISTMVSTYDFAENTSTGDAVATFEATDPDAGAVLTWTLTGNDAADFNISRDTDQNGVLTFRSSPNFEMPAGTPENSMAPPDNTYEVTVQVTDGEDEEGNTDPAVDDSLAVVVTVTDVNEPPEIDTTDTTYDFAENTLENTTCRRLVRSHRPGRRRRAHVDGHGQRRDRLRNQQEQ